MKTYNHARYDLVHYYELSEQQQRDYPEQDYLDQHFCININDDNDIHLLNDFISIPRGRYHGFASCSNTSAYGIVLSRDGEQAVIALIG